MQYSEEYAVRLKDITSQNSRRISSVRWRVSSKGMGVQYDGGYLVLWGDSISTVEGCLQEDKDSVQWKDNVSMEEEIQHSKRKSSVQWGISSVELRDIINTVKGYQYNGISPSP